MKPKRLNNHHRAGILIVDDHPLVREWLSRLVNEQQDMSSCGEAADPHQALEMAARLKPDLVICDLSLNKSSGIDLIKDLQIRHPALPVLVLSMHEAEVYAERALRAGANGYINKHAAADEVLEAIRQVLRGQMYVSSEFTGQILQKFFRGRTAQMGFGVDLLSDRELEVFQLIGRGKSSQEIAEQLHISAKTVESYRTRLKEKLNLSSARELLQRAVEWMLAEGH